ncbi:unnamed protein product [Rotaria sp. Silwood2]|nr:unnamed protein product [Rotaria sp. Silwood2]
MSRKFRCGRLMLTKDRTIKKLELENGGGTRFCTWDNDDMDFDTVHRRLLNIYKLNSRKLNTSLYDFQHRPLNKNEYKNFSQYINIYGLNANSTIIYLCTNAVNDDDDDDDDDQPEIIMTKTKNVVPIKPSTDEQKTSTLIRTSSPTTCLTKKFVIDNQQLHQFSLGNQLIIIDLYDDVLYLEYSFKIASNNLIKYVHNWINQNSFDQISIQLFEYVCILNGYVCSTIDPLIEKMKQSNQYFQLMSESEIILHTNSFNHIHDICESTNTLLMLNKKQFDHIEIFSMINNSFSEVYDNLKTLRNRWLENVNNKFNTSSSSSSDLFKSVPSLREPADEETNEKFALFEPILNCSNHLLNLLYRENLSKFREAVLLMIEEIESIRSTINLHDEQSLHHARRTILSTKDQINNTFYQQYIIYSECELNRQLDISCQKILKAIKFILTSIDRYQIQLDQNNRKKYSNWSSPPRSFIHPSRTI